MRTVAETPTFTRQCDKIFSENEKRELVDFLAENPLAGDEIPGTGGVRKVRFASSGKGKCKETTMTNSFADDLVQSLSEAVAHSKGEGAAIVHEPVDPRVVRIHAKLTQAQMAPLLGMSLSGYRKWEQGQRRISGPAATLLTLLAKEPDAVKRALLVDQ